jgi:hypothetical protein
VGTRDDRSGLETLQGFQAEGLIYFNLMRQRQFDKHKYRWSADGDVLS